MTVSGTAVAERDRILSQHAVPALVSASRGLLRQSRAKLATRTGRNAAAWLSLLLGAGLFTSDLRSQGVLTVTPGATIGTAAGTGHVGYAGDGGAATNAALARPSGVAYDSSGDLFVADTNNHVVREISPGGVITTIAGTGVAGFGGDNGPATAAFLDTPTGVAVDPSGKLYIADSHNHRVRMVSHGAITTLAGTGTSGFSGDGGAANSAQLALPSGVALDAAGNLYIADTNNQRIRKVSGGTIATFAGNGEESFTGDGGSARAASLDQPTAVALDPAGTLYIADKNNHRVRVVSSAGIISTLAGSGGPAFAGSFGGDGANATAATLARPVGISVDPSGNVYVADTNNQRIRQISASGAISTVAGTSEQGFAGDGGLALNAILNSPRGISTDASGNLVVADTRDQRLRAVAGGQISFGSQAVGTTSAPQLITLSNIGAGSLTVTSASLNGPFALVSGGTCPAAPITLPAGANCTEKVVYQPAVVSSGSGAIVFSGAGVNTQTVLLSGGIAAQGTTTLALTESKTASLSGESVTFTATLSAPASGALPTGSVTFYDGSTLLGTRPLVNGLANLSTTLPDGTQTITAAYNGNANLASSSSTAITQNVADFTLGSSSSTTATVEPGHSIAVPVMLTAGGVTGLTANILLTVGALPPGLSSVSFSPATASLINGQLAFTMNVTAAPAGQASVHGLTGTSGGAAVLALLLWPVLGRRRGGWARGLRPLLLVLAFAGAGALVTGLTGCGASSGFFGQAEKRYTMNVAATATDSTGGTLIRNTSVVINVQ